MDDRDATPGGGSKEADDRRRGVEARQAGHRVGPRPQAPHRVNPPGAPRRAGARRCGRGRWESSPSRRAMAIPSCQVCESAALISLVSIARRRRHASMRHSRPWPTDASWLRSRTDNMPSPTRTSDVVLISGGCWIRLSPSATAVMPSIGWVRPSARCQAESRFRCASASTTSRSGPTSPSYPISSTSLRATPSSSRATPSSRSGPPPSGGSCARRTRPRPSPASSTTRSLVRACRWTHRSRRSCLGWTTRLRSGHGRLPSAWPARVLSSCSAIKPGGSRRRPSGPGSGSSQWGRRARLSSFPAMSGRPSKP